MRNVWEWEHENFQASWKRLSRWGDYRVIGEKQQADCVVCGKPCIIAVGEPYEFHGQRAYDPVALYCPTCGLHWEPEHKELVRLHYGPITKERFGEEAWQQEIDVFGDE